MNLPVSINTECDDIVTRVQGMSGVAETIQVLSFLAAISNGTECDMVE